MKWLRSRWERDLGSLFLKCPPVPSSKSSTGQVSKTLMNQRNFVAGGPGFEPRLPGPEPGVLPLNYPPTAQRDEEITRPPPPKQPQADSCPGERGEARYRMIIR